VVTLRLPPEPNSSKDASELLSERIRSVVRDRIIEDVRASIIYNALIMRLPIGVRFQRDMSRYCLVITDLLNKPPREPNPVLCLTSPYYMLFVYPIIVALSPELVIAYVKVARTVSTISMTRAETASLIKSILEGDVPVPNELLSVFQRYNVTWELWKKGLCTLLKEFLTRWVRTAPIEDVIEVKDYVAHCLAEGLPYSCLLKALPRPIAYAIYQLVYLCDELQFVIGSLLSKEGAIVGTEKLKEEEKEWLQRALEITKLFRETK
jgi:hypothetical protein